MDIEQSFWITQRIKSNVKRVVDQGNHLNMRCFICGDSQKNKRRKRGYYYKQTCSYHCFNCGETLIGFNIVARLEGRTYKDIKREYLQEKYGRKFNSGVDSRFLQKETTTRPAINLNGFSEVLPDHAIRYLSDRRIMDAPYLYPDMKFMYDSLEDRLIIPWYYNEKVNYYQRRALSGQTPKYLFPRLEKTVFNIDMVDPSFPYIFILEGAFDSIFVKNGVAIGGKNLSEYQLDLLSKKWPKHKLVYFFDNHRYKDEISGSAPMYKHILNLIEKKPNSKFLLWPSELKHIKDVNQLVMEGIDNPFIGHDWLEKSIKSSLQTKFIIKSEFPH